MLKRFFFPLAILISVMPVCQAEVIKPAIKPGEFVTLCYHAIPDRPKQGDIYSIPQRRFTEQIEYLKTHGYHPVSLNDIIQAHKGGKPLPANAVFLTFDDGYVSYYNFVVPLLAKYGYPSMLAVESSFIAKPPKDLPEKIMSWDQLRELSKNKLVALVSHTYDMHGAIQYNPSGNVAPVVSIRGYDPKAKRYETGAEYRARIERDFRQQNSIFQKELGYKSNVIVWPHGRYNDISWDVARKYGYELGFTLEWGFQNVRDLHAINRILIENEPISSFIEKITYPTRKGHIRAAQVDLDLIYDPESFARTDVKLGKLIDRLYEMKINTVFLQAFADPEGSGNIKSVYFPNRVLPVRSDIFSHVAHQLMIRDIAVYAWMPTLSIVFPNAELDKRLRVRELAGGKPRLSRSWYHRLSPFSEEVKKRVRMLYEDLAAHTQLEGILFQDDAYLTDREDFHPAAIASYKKKFGSDMVMLALKQNDQALMNRWTDYKTQVLIDYTKDLMHAVRRFQPEAKFARNIYAGPVMEPQSEEWFAQNYDNFLQAYDYVVVMAYPQMEKTSHPIQWLRKLVRIAKGSRHNLKKTIFKVQAYDWKRELWLKDGLVLSELRHILAAGGINLAYYPDNFLLNRPELSTIKLEMSTRTAPDGSGG